MKRMKRMFSLMLVLALAAAMLVPAHAEEEKGSITVNVNDSSAVFKIYKMLDLESYDTATGNYAYRVDPQWAEFFALDATKQYYNVNTNGYIVWVGSENEEVQKQQTKEIAQAALEWAKTKGIEPDKSSNVAGEFVLSGNAGVFENLDLGYYLVDSNMGALCGLTTTNPHASVTAKNGMPTVDKQVQEDSPTKWGADNTAEIGEVYNYRVLINVHAGAQNYILHDHMSEGIEFVNYGETAHPEVKVTLNGSDVSTDNYTVVHNAQEHTYKEVQYPCSFEVRFKDTFCAGLKTNDNLMVEYKAKLNENAVIFDGDNPNKAWLEFGEGFFTTHDIVTTKTFEADLVKTNSQHSLIDGASFLLFDNKTADPDDSEDVSKHIIPVIKIAEKKYRIATPEEISAGTHLVNGTDPNNKDSYQQIVVKDGMVTIIGFDNDTYYLEETVTPNGYNKLAARHEFTVADGNLKAIFNGPTYSTNSGIHIVNQSGTMLPETGGIGTTIFYLVGGGLMIAAVVLLITKKRMSEQK